MIKMDYIVIDTTDKHLKILLVYGGREYSHCERAELTHSETLLPALDNLLKQAECRMPDLQAAGAVTGPGSFTGIRIGIATLKGFSAAIRSLKLLAVNSALLKSYASLREAFDAEIAAGEFLSVDELKPVYLCNPQAAGDFQLKTEAVTPGDVPQIAALEKRYFTNPETSGMILSRITNPSARVACIRDGGLICAYMIARAAAGVCELETIAVRRAYRRLGFSAFLMRDLLDFAKEMNCSEIRLEARSDNVSAIALYEKFGFVKTGVRKGYYADGGDCINYKLQTPKRGWRDKG